MTLAYFEVLFEAGRVTPKARKFVLELTPKQRFALCIERPEAFAATVRELAGLGFTLGDLERLAGPPRPEHWGRTGPEGAALSKTRSGPEGADRPDRCRSVQEAAVGPRERV